MSIEDRAKAAGKNIEGKAQEALGNVQVILKIKQKAKPSKQKLKSVTLARM